MRLTDKERKNMEFIIHQNGRETSKHIVAYFDLLGVTNRIENMNDQQIEMNRLHGLFSQHTNMLKLKEFNEIKYRIFSDNILFAQKLSADMSERILQIGIFLNFITYLPCYSTQQYGWLLRGGIAIDEFYIDGNILWGKALTKAYGLESKIAIYPRILFDSTVLEEINKIEGFEKLIRKDFDNMYYLNYLCNPYISDKELYDGFELMKDELKDRNDKHKMQKLYWHMNYVNEELDKMDNYKEKEFRLKI